MPNEIFVWTLNFIKLKVVTKKDPYPFPFTNEVMNIIIKHEVYTFLNGFLGCHQISITLED